MKKLVALMLVGAMTAAMVTGCGSSADTSASTTVDDWSSYEVERPESL